MVPSYGQLLSGFAFILGLFFLYGGFKALFEPRKDAYERKSVGSNVTTAIIMILIGLLLVSGILMRAFRFFLF